MTRRSCRVIAWDKVFVCWRFDSLSQWITNGCSGLCLRKVTTRALKLRPYSLAFQFSEHLSSAQWWYTRWASRLCLNAWRNYWVIAWDKLCTVGEDLLIPVRADRYGTVYPYGYTYVYPVQYVYLYWWRMGVVDLLMKKECLFWLQVVITFGALDESAPFAKVWSYLFSFILIYLINK